VPTNLSQVFCRLAVVRAALFSFAVLVVSSLLNAACAEEIRILSAAAMQTVFKDVRDEFERTTGHKLTIAYGTIGGITERIQNGETAGYVIGSSLSMPALVRDNKIEPGSLTLICKTGIGLIVPAGDAKPKIVSVEEFKQALLAAKAVVYADPVRGGAAGVHIAKVLKRLGIADQLKSQITLGAGGDVTEVTIAHGAGSLGMTQISEIAGKTSAEYVGPLPIELQNYTEFVGGVLVDSKPSEATLALIKYLKSPIAVTAIRARGMTVD
jgi:molybdate transport system substrate-binding protein